jgi:PilZ domain
MPASTRQSAESQMDRRRRRHARYRSNFRVAVSHLGNHYQTVEGHCRDLSEAGIGILLAAELENGEVVSLSFSLPGSLPSWEVRTVVRYRRGYQYGFEFLSLTSEQQESLKSYLETLPLLAY